MQDIEEIYNNYAQIVYKYIFCLTKNKELSEDIVQETFLVAVKNIDKFRGESKISTWLCQIAKFILYKDIRKKEKQKNISLEDVENELKNENIVLLLYKLYNLSIYVYLIGQLSSLILSILRV